MKLDLFVISEPCRCIRRAAHGTSGAATARMGTSGFRLLLHLLLALLLGKQTLGLKQCDNCVHINDCRQWCSKIADGASKLSLEEAS